ncbi:hypothetical protein [Tellurirhabdus bombi]|uniref:hypothetical protein n=1 Tax=Tellurirhabdus bombi TaxID=2907205 RepID=UPI001F2CCD8D|nr:hypothetical protein [Tellurirhabdus bombi]
MFQSLIRFVGRLYALIWSFIIIAFLAFVAWLLWHFYGEARLDRQFTEAGERVRVQVKAVDSERRTWFDLGQSVYLSFDYKNKRYTTRYVFDTTWANEGDYIQLLYHPQVDEFRQVPTVQKANSSRLVSRLIRWSSLHTLSTEHKMLGGFLFILLFLFFYAGGVVVGLTGWTFPQQIARFTLLLALGAAALFFTYETVTYYRYYQRIRVNGKPMEVTVLETDRHSVGHSRSSSFKQYNYEVVFRYQNQERVAPITEDEYDVLKPQSRLRVLHDEALDDFMSATYPGDYLKILVPLFFWILFIILWWNTFFKSRSKYSR